MKTSGNNELVEFATKLCLNCDEVNFYLGTTEQVELAFRLELD